MTVRRGSFPHEVIALVGGDHLIKEAGLYSHEQVIATAPEAITRHGDAAPFMRLIDEHPSVGLTCLRYEIDA